MKNIFVLPTDKPSRLHNKNGELGNYPSTKLYIEDFKGNQHNSFHIYITNSEKIKEGDWALDLCEDLGLKYQPFKVDKATLKYANQECKKIILTTDPDLIADGIQKIDDTFLEWFVNNSSCGYVEIDYQTIGLKDGIWQYNYKIIIPQEEPKQDLEKYIFENLKEYYKTTPREKVLKDWNKSAYLNNIGPTVDEFVENSNEERLKEAAEKFYSEQSESYENAIEPTFDNSRYLVAGFIDGAKWQAERMYTYDELRQIAYNAYCLGQLEEPTENKYNLWIQQFKKK
jgi:hypothetical protein